jgi:starch synthase
MALLLRNFSPDRALWRRKFYLDTTYYDLLSRKIARSLHESDRAYDVLQIGGIYRLRPMLASDRRLFSYHDANLAQALRHPQFPQHLTKKRIARALDYERNVYDGIDVIFTMSDYLRGTFIECFGVEERRVTTIGAGINLETLPSVVAGKAYDNKKLLFVGANFERKGGMELLRAFQVVRSAHPTAELCIVGPRNICIPPEMSRGVVYAGFLSKNDPVQMRQFERILATSSLFVMPSLYEPFGIAPLEAMAHCIPAVLTNAWAFPEMVTPGVNGELVKPGDAADLAEKLIALLHDPDRLRAMGVAGRARVTDRFTWPAVVSRLRAALSNVPNRQDLS